MSRDLLSRSRELKARAEAASRGIEAQTESARSKEATRLFAEADRTMATCATQVRSLRGTGIDPDVVECGEQIVVLGERLSEQLDTSNVALQALATDTQHDIALVVNEVAQALRETILAWAQNQPQPEDRFLEVMSDLAPKQTKRMRTATSGFIAELDAAMSKLGRFDQLTAAGQEAARAYQELTAALPAAVSEFVRAVAGGKGAPLHRLDQPVIDWLRERDLDRSFVVHFRRS